MGWEACWHCSDLRGAVGEAAVLEPEPQAGGRGPLLPFTGMWGGTEPRGAELVFPDWMALFGVPGFGRWHVEEPCRPQGYGLG